MQQTLYFHGNIDHNITMKGEIVCSHRMLKETKGIKYNGGAAIWRCPRFATQSNRIQSTLLTQTSDTFFQSILQNPNVLQSAGLRKFRPFADINGVIADAL